MQNLSKAQQLRERRNQLMEASSQHSSAIADKAKLISAGETSQLIASSLAKLKLMNRKDEERGIFTKIRAMMPFMEKIEEVEKGIEVASAKGSSVSEVTRNLMDAVTQKRETIENIVNDLFELYDNIEHTYNETKQLTEEIRADLANGVYEKADKFNVDTLLAELLEYRTIMKENLHSAKNTIQAAQVSVHQIVSLQPKLKAQLDDGLSILVALNELEELNKTCADLEELCHIVRDDNREKAADAQLKAINRQVKSQEQLLRIENSAKRHQQLDNLITAEFKKAAASVESKVLLMERIVDSESDHIKLENKNNHTFN